MSLSVPSVNYSYAAGSIGFEAIGASAEISANSSLSDIYGAYAAVFGRYSAMHTTLLKQLGTVLSLLGASGEYEGRLDLSTIFDNHKLIDVLAMNQGECKEGAKAYKYYLGEAVRQLNALHTWNKRANELLGQLNALGEGHESKAHYLIAELEIADQHAQEVIKAFTQHAVVKYLTVNKDIHYNDGTRDREEKSAPEKYQSYELDYARVLKQEGDRYTYESWLEDSYDSLEELRKIETKKFAVTREITTTYYKDKTKTEKADKYDDSAYREMTISDVSAKEVKNETEKAIVLFDELSLLDKLKYIILYYKISDDRYVYPQDASIGFPCVRPERNLKPSDDTAELGQLEMFYIGYLVDRDGPVNAMASFMEVKSVAVQAQIVLMSYRIKALKYYIDLLNKGLEALNQSQSSDRWLHEGVEGFEGKEKPVPIPYVSYYILQFLGGSTARSLLYFKDANGDFLKNESGKEVREPYLVMQCNNGDKKVKGKDANGSEVTYTYHLTQSDTYLIAEATDEGVNAMYDFLSSFNIPIDGGVIAVEEKLSEVFYNRNNWVYGYEDEQGNYKIGQPNLKLPNEGSGTYNMVFKKTSNSPEQQETYKKVLSMPDKCFFLRLNETVTDGFISETGLSVMLLPKELEVVLYDVSTIINQEGCVRFDGAGNFSKDFTTLDQKKDAWQTYVKKWTDAYDTVISNHQSQLEYAQKSVTSLRQKISTFDTIASNFRSKAYTIYNKIVNKIN